MSSEREAANGGGSGRRTGPMALLEDPMTIRARWLSNPVVAPALTPLPTVREAASPSRRPTDDEWQTMTDAVEYVTYAPPEKEAAARRIATDLVVRSFGIDLTHVREILFDPDLGDQAQTHAGTGVIRLPASAFQDGPGALAALLLHEVTHANQGELRGDTDPPHPNVLAYEVMAYQTAETHAQELRLGQDFLDTNRKNREQILEWLHADNRQRLQVTGEYWLMDEVLPSDPEAFDLVGAEFSGSTDPTRLELLVRGGRV